ncbi:MAG: dTDP-4-dehydrorhamnose reductase [Planctomycetota bacterium]
MSTPQILVTGAAGQLGKELCLHLGERALGVDVAEIDLCDSPALRAALADIRPSAVVNCAAYTAVDKAESEPDLCRAVNTGAVAVLAAECRELEVPLVQISTDYVFGDPGPRRPWRENDPPSPRGAYATTKLEGEQVARRCPRHLIVRTCGLYARPTDEQAKNFVRTMLRLGSGGKPLKVVDDQHCTPSYVPHVARAIVFLLQAAESGRARWGTYHVTNDGETTWFEFAAEIFRIAKLDVVLERITTAEYGAPAPRPAYSVLSTSNYRALGGPPLPDWRDALTEYFLKPE